MNVLTRERRGSTIPFSSLTSGESVRKAALGLLFVIMFCVWVPGQMEETCLKVDATINPRWLSRGQEGKVVLKIKLSEGVTINPQPSFIIECDPSDELIFPKDFFTASDLEIEIKEEMGEEYLNLDEPVEIPFTVSLDAKRGNHSFAGRIKYFAFSKQDGWCLKSTAKFAASFYTRSTRVK